MVVRKSTPSSAQERPCDVSGELDGDTERDDEVDERDGVEADAPEAHDSHHVEDDEGAGGRHERGRLPGAEQERRDEHDGAESEDQDLDEDGSDVRVLEEDQIVSTRFECIRDRKIQTWSKKT